MVKRLLWLLTAGLVLTGLLLTSCSSSPATTPSTNPLIAITVGTDASWPPFSSIDKATQQFLGYEIDIINAIAARENLKITFLDQSYDALLAGLVKGKYDAAIASIVITDDLKKDMLFSDPYFAAGQIIVVRQDDFEITGEEDLRGNIGAVKGSVGAGEIEKIKAAQLVPYEKIDVAFQDLSDSKIDAVVCENSAAVVFVGQSPDIYKTVGGVFTDENWGIALNRGNKELQAKMNAGLSQIKSDGSLDRFAQNWFK
jgi:polar amino acid transport system substrate-binding protein